jgi:hypothetical protein
MPTVCEPWPGKMNAILPLLEIDPLVESVMILRELEQV